MKILFGPLEFDENPSQCDQANVSRWITQLFQDYRIFISLAVPKNFGIRF